MTALLLALPLLAAQPAPAPHATLATGSTVATVQDDRSVISGARNAVVHVSVRFLRPQGGGRDPLVVPVERPSTGFLISADGLVVTNAHLVAEVPLGDGEEGQEYWAVVETATGDSFPAKVIARDERSDLALLQLEGVGKRELPRLRLANPGEDADGSRVIALCAARHAMNVHAFAGALARPRGPQRLREALLEPGEVVLCDARFHDSLDGAPLLDGLGRVIGVHNSSHITATPFAFGDPEEDKDEPKINLDYAMIVSTAAFAKAFGEHMDGISVSDDPPAADKMCRSLAKASTAVVGVWSGDAEAYPKVSEEADPHGLRLPEALGSGVVVDPSGLVLACSRNVEENAASILVRLEDGTTHPARVLQRAPKLQSVLLQVELPEGTALPSADLSRALAPVHGEPIGVLGRPHLGPPTQSVGVLSAPERSGLVQVAAWVHKGHWGGLIHDGEGRMLGLAVGQPADAHGVTEESYLGFGAPLASLLENFADHWQAPAYDGAPIGPVPSRVSDVVANTHGALINVLVSRRLPKKSAGFDPFGSGDGGDSFQMLGQGSGVVIDGSGIALSNWHVVDAALADDGSVNPDFRVEITTQDDRRFDAKVLSTSRDDDLALLAIQLPEGERLHPVELGRSLTMRPGDPVVAIGNPHGLANSVSTGIVSALNQTVQIQGRARAYHGMLQTDAAINPGNSGGALLDIEGRLIGINSAGRTGAGLAIPIDKAREVFRDKLLSVGRLRSSYFGFEVKELQAGLTVRTVDAAGPGAAAGVETGDLVLAVGSNATANGIAFAQAQLEARPWQPLAVRVQRDGEEHELELVPISFGAWRAFQQSGIGVEPLAYASEPELVRSASLALHRAYTGDSSGTPRVLMAGALRVTRVRPPEEDELLDVEPGDLLLGMTVVREDAQLVRHELVRFESMQDLGAGLDPIATREGNDVELWILRGDEVLRIQAFVKRAKR